MRRALNLARQGRFTVSPNPRVGCVIVKQPEGKSPSPPASPHQLDSLIIGEGYHRRKGMPHAEREALAACKEDPRGATMYVTLEPCCHYGATPPCTEAILEAGIKRVVVAVQDPFEHVNGRGIHILRKQQVDVLVGVLEEEAKYENRFFFHHQETGLPWVILKCASSLDGKLATRTGDSKWISSDASRAFAHEMRAESDAVLAGIGTVMTDDPYLTARPENLTRESFNPPVRVILDPYLTLPLKSHLLATLSQSPVWIYTSDRSTPDKQKQIESMGASLIVVPRVDSGLDLRAVLEDLGRKNILNAFVEGGPRIHTAFLEAGLVNEAAVFIAPLIVGGGGAPTFYMGQGAATIKEAKRLERIERECFGPDTLIRGILRWRL